MKAVVLTRFGGEGVLEVLETPDPRPGRGEVLIQVRACGVNHVDLDVRAGISRFPVKLPLILGREISGDVVEVGSDVRSLREGDRVAAGEMFTACWRCELCLNGRDNLCWSVDYPGLMRDGGYAELVALPESYCVPLAPDLSHQVSAAGQITFGTAWRALVHRSLGVFPGETILITGAASGVGSAGIQVAGLLGLRVIAVVGSRLKVEAVKGLGAEEVIVYGEEDVADRVRDWTGGRGVDLVFDIVGGELFRESMKTLRYGGRLVLAGAHAGEVMPTDLIEVFRYERTILGTARATRGEMALVMSMLAERRLSPVIDSIMPTSRAADAHRRLASRENVGKVILVPDSELSLG